MASSFGSPQLVQARRSSSCMATLTHTHIVWRKLGPRLAEHFSVVATHLRGYGDSSKPPPEAFAEYLHCYDSAAPDTTTLEIVEMLAQENYPVESTLATAP
jgi:hypothetical protein